MKRISIFKKVAILAVALTISVVANAQYQGDKAIGGHLAFGSGGSYTNNGIGVKFQYNVTDPIRLEGSYTSFFKKDYISMWDFSANVHWLFEVADKIRLYPLAGLGTMGIKVEVRGLSASESYFGLRFGGGMDVDLSDHLILNFQLKYQTIEDGNRTMLSAGLAYKF